MQIEYEATFTNINKDEIRKRLMDARAKLVQAEFIMKRTTFNFPKGQNIKGGWLRVRDEGNKITLTLKVVDGNKIEDQKEILLKIDDYSQAELLLDSIGCKKKSYQESKREVWNLDGVEIDIDEWPYLEPFLEIEGESEEEVKRISEKLGFDYSSALFCCVSTLYSKKYGVTEEFTNTRIPKITFEDINPFDLIKE